MVNRIKNHQQKALKRKLGSQRRETFGLKRRNKDQDKMKIASEDM
jgi:hypothetical protein